MKKTFLFCLFFLSLTYKHTYGTTVNQSSLHPISFQPELPSWEEVQEIIPIKSTFTVIDVDTGKKFSVQRRAGSGHADVQPLSKSDTEIMKDIYSGHWSWRRRAVLIQVNDRLIPASMHGMPHGAGAIQNGFPGHFCIHFSESKTHRSNKVDLSHHVMILKAAGKFDEYINGLQPDEFLEIFLIVIKNHDMDLLKKIIVTNQQTLENSIQSFQDIQGMQWTIKPCPVNDLYTLTVKQPVEMKILLKNVGPVTVNHTFTLVRTSPVSSWRVMIDPFLYSIHHDDEEDERK